LAPARHVVIECWSVVVIGLIVMVGAVKLMMDNFAANRRWR